jgi:hypothetical protein
MCARISVDPTGLLWRTSSNSKPSNHELCRHTDRYKLKFDKFVKGGNFFGLERLQVHAALGDPTYARERLSYALFREMGIAAPRTAATSVSVVVGGQKYTMGYHLLTEVCGDRFL